MMSLIVILILLLALLGMPLFAVMGSIGLIAFYQQEIATSAVIVEIYRLTSSPTLVSIPLFTFAGFVLAESKTPKRLLDLSNALFGWLPGGTAIMSLVLCAFFTAFTGASGVTIVALGGLLYPILMEKGYDEKFTLGLITSSGSLGLLFPPSLPLILYGIVAKVPIDNLFKAGIVPGILIIIILAGYSILKSKGNASRIPFNFNQLKLSLYQSRFEIPLPILILGGIYGGIITVTEAATLTVVYVLIVEVLLYKDLSFKKDIPKLTVESMTLVGAILLILSCAMGLTNYLVDEEVPMQILEFLRNYIDSRFVFLLFLNFFLLIVGSLMDIFSAIIVVVPLLLPVAQEFQVHPIHMAMIFLTNLEIGYITPPIGLNLFISSFRFNRSVLELYKATFVYLLLLVVALLIITYIPWLSLFWF